MIWLLVCGGCGTYLIWLVMATADAAMCHYNLNSLGRALQDFDARNGSLPPAYICDQNGKPIHSWNTLLIPYVGFSGWRSGYRLNEPWDGPNNSKVRSEPVAYFRCPNIDVDGRSPSIVDYVAIVGPDTMWPGRERVQLPLKGAGNQDMILLIELPDSDYRFLEPRFPTVDEFLERIKSPTGTGIRCIHTKGLAYVTVGGEVRYFPCGTDPETIRPLFKRDPSLKVIQPQKVEYY